jgi:hypothetical protein
MRSKQNTYERGYLPKISYHLAKGNSEKVEYFMNRHTQAYGALTPGDLYFVTERVKHLQQEWRDEEMEFNNHLGKL